MKNTNKIYLALLGVFALLSFTTVTMYRYYRGTHLYNGNIDVTGNVYGENLRPRLLVNRTHVERPGNILFELPEGEQTGIHSAYGASATRIADSDSLIALLKGDRTDLAYYYLSEDNGDSYTLIDTLWSTRADWYTDRMQEGITFYENDTIFYMVKGRTGDDYSVGLFYSLRSDIATVYEYGSNPLLTDTDVGDDLGITVGDISVNDIIYRNDSCYVVAALLDSAAEVYNTYLFSGVDKYNLTVKHKLFNGRPSSLALGGSIFQDADTMWHILEDIETNGSRYITSRYARTLYGTWYEESGSFLQPYHSTTSWDNYGVKGARLLKDNNNRCLADTIGGYSQVYYSGDSVNLNVQRSGRVKVYFDYARVDTALTYHDTSAQLATKTYVSSNAAILGGQSISTDTMKIGATNEKDISLVKNNIPAYSISGSGSSYTHTWGDPSTGNQYTYWSDGIVYKNWVSGLQANGSVQPYAYLYGYIMNNTGSAALDNARIGYIYFGDGTNKKGGISLEGRNGSGWLGALVAYAGNFTQVYNALVVGNTDKNPQTYVAPSILTVDGGDVEVTDSTKGLILKSPDGTRYKLTIPNGGASVTITAL